MDPGFEQRARRRRQTWSAGVSSGFAAHELDDLRFWMSTTPSVRLTAAWNLAIEAISMQAAAGEEHGSTSRLSRSVGGVRRGGG